MSLRDCGVGVTFPARVGNIAVVDAGLRVAGGSCIVPAVTILAFGSIRIASFNRAPVHTVGILGHLRDVRRALKVPYIVTAAAIYLLRRLLVRESLPAKVNVTALPSRALTPFIAAV